MSRSKPEIKPLKKQRIDEASIKARVLNELKAHGRIDRRTLLASEFCLGRTGVRADLVIWADELIGIEIKSELDSLRRLDSQLSACREFCDRTILVAASRHMKRLDPSKLRDVEMWEVTPDGTLHVRWSSSVSAIRQPPRWDRLMTKAELRRFNRDEDIGAGREAFHRAFCDRFASNSHSFWTRVGRRQIKPEDLALLSRYREARQSLADWSSAQSVDWEQWLESTMTALGATTQLAEHDHAS
jgi:hypothetical protein